MDIVKKNLKNGEIESSFIVLVDRFVIMGWLVYLFEGFVSVFFFIIIILIFLLIVIISLGIFLVVIIFRYERVFFFF